MDEPGFLNMDSPRAGGNAYPASSNNGAVAAQNGSEIAGGPTGLADPNFLNMQKDDDDSCPDIEDSPENPTG